MGWRVMVEPMMRPLPALRIALPLCLTAVLGLGCEEPPAEGEPLPDAICTAGTSWSEGTPAFREASVDFGLDVTGAAGTRVSAVDLDGDGWTDLVVRRGGLRNSDFSTGDQHTWVLHNDGGVFTDVTESSGFLAARVAGEQMGRGGDVYAFADVDNDGDLDAFAGLDTTDVSKSLGETSEIVLGAGDGSFALGPRDSDVRNDGVSDDVDVPAGASFIDFDRDGFVDLFVPQHNYTPAGGGITFRGDRLLKGDGTGAFVEVTADVGMVTEDWGVIDVLNEGRAHSRAWGAAACDLNGDGWTELLVPSYGRSPNHLWQGVSSGEAVGFLNRSVDSGYAYDDDLSWQDNQFARCFCQSNPTADGCDEVGAPAIGCSTPNWSHDQDRQPFRLGGNSGATVCADVNNDGAMDLLTSEIKHWWAGAGSDGGELLINSGESEVRFDRPGRESMGIAVEHVTSSWDEGHMSATVFDFDNDGWPDIYVGASDYPGNRGHLFHQRAPLEFEEVGTSEGIDHNRSHGVAVADFDRDGDLDVVVGHSRARCDAAAPNNCYETQAVRLFENVVGDAGNFVQLRLLGGEGTNRAAIGARVTLSADGVTQTHEVGGGYGHYGAQDDLVQHFGLGTACEAEVEVRWPDAALTTERFTLPAGHRFEIEQGQGPRVVEK
jgi:hypothetical protein